MRTQVIFPAVSIVLSVVLLGCTQAGTRNIAAAGKHEPIAAMSPPSANPDPDLDFVPPPGFFPLTSENGDPGTVGFYEILSSTPDCEIAVGLNYAALTVNGYIKVVDKSTLAEVWSMGISEFLGTTQPGAPIVSDTVDGVIVYNRHNGIFYYFNMTSDGSEINYAYTSTPEAIGTWTKGAFEVVDSANQSLAGIDFPNIGYDEKYVYISTHVPSGSHGDLGDLIYAWDVSGLQMASDPIGISD